MEDRNIGSEELVEICFRPDILPFQKIMDRYADLLKLLSEESHLYDHSSNTWFMSKKRAEELHLGDFVVDSIQRNRHTKSSINLKKKEPLHFNDNLETKIQIEEEDLKRIEGIEKAIPKTLPGLFIGKTMQYVSSTTDQIRDCQAYLDGLPESFTKEKSKIFKMYRISIDEHFKVIRRRHLLFLRTTTAVVFIFLLYVFITEVVSVPTQSLKGIIWELYTTASSLLMKITKLITTLLVV